MEGEDSVTLAVRRRGPQHGEVAAEWENENLSTAGDSFLPQSGVLRFSPGQSRAEIRLKLLDDDAWNLEAAQIVRLRVPRGAAVGDEGDDGQSCAGVVIGDPGAAAVGVINDDPFPHGLRDEQVSDKILTVRKFILHLRNLMRSETAWGVAYKSWDGVKSVMDQVILLLFLSFTLEDLEDSQTVRLAELCALLGVFVANFAIKHVLDHLFIRLRLGGKANISLRMAVTATAMQFTNEEQGRFPPGKIARVVESDVQIANETVWASSFELVSLLSRLVCSLVYVTYLNLSQLDTTGVAFAVVLTIIPVVIFASDFTVTIKNYHKSARIAYEAGEAGDEVTSYGAELSSLRQTIEDADKTQQCLSGYRRLHAHANDVLVRGVMHGSASEYTARWISTLLSTGLFGITGYLVIANGYPVANFVTLYNSMMSFSATLTGIFDASFRILEGYGPVMKLREVLNAETHNKELLRFSRQQRKLRDALEKDASVMRPIAGNELRLQGVAFSFDNEAEVFPALSFGIEPGQVVALHSPPSFGSRTILQLIARHIVPSEGLIQYPSSWRVCYIDSIPTLFHDTLMANLRFREIHEHTDEEVWDLCRLFGLNEDLVGKGDFMVGSGGTSLSSSDRVMVSLLSGMLSSPDLILLPGVLDRLGEEMAVRTLEILKAFTVERCFPCLRSENARLEKTGAKDKLVLLSTKLGEVRDSADSAIRLAPDSPGPEKPEQATSAAELPPSPDKASP